ncbi:MAG: diguanylate cyclase [Lachnospiraceae bacterium]|nr:diguanylate cyclase [Lachnospiraceae bacterium]
MDSKVVIVDDEAISLTNARIILNEHGIHASCLRSGKDLLKFMKKNIPDLILMDVMMPDMDGFTTYRALRMFEDEEDRPHTPVIFMTGDNDNETERRGLKAGASDFIHKPFNKEILITRINNTIKNNRAMESLAEEASVDKLTGFLNKSSGTEKISRLCANETGALAVFDLDSFKLVNDLYGHDMGDQVLIAFAEVLRINTRTEDVISRIGGDEFMAFFKDISDEKSVASISRRLNDQIVSRCSELMGDEFDIPIGISIGAVMIPENGKEYEQLFRYADQTLFRVKQGGKHGYALYDPAIETDDQVDPMREMAKLTQIVEERGAGKGAMLLGQDAFSWSYRYIMRFIRRYSRVASKMMFFMTPKEEDIDISPAMVCFSEVLQNTLRRSDIIMQSGNNRYFILLPELKEKDLDSVTERIMSKWETTEFYAVTDVTYVAETVSS